MAGRSETAVLLLLVFALVTAQAASFSVSPGRKLLQGGDRPGHDYAQSISILASQTAIQRLTVKGATGANIKEASELSLRNAQTATKNWPKASRYTDGVKGASVSRDGDGDK